MHAIRKWCVALAILITTTVLIVIIIWRGIPPEEINDDIARQKLESLGKSRDPQEIAVVIQALFTTNRDRPTANGFAAFGPNSARDILIRLGDQRGDVYEPIRDGILSHDRTGETSSLLFATQALGQIDPERALADETKWLTTGSLKLRQSVAASLDYIGTEPAMALAARLLTDHELGESAVYSFYSVPREGLTGPDPLWTSSQRTKVQMITTPFLITALHSPAITGKQRETLEFLRHTLDGGPPPTVTVEEAMGMCHHPKPGTFDDFQRGPYDMMLQNIGRTADPAFLPLLFRSMIDDPVTLDGTISIYPLLDRMAYAAPVEFEREMNRQGWLSATAAMERFKNRGASPSYAALFLQPDFWPRLVSASFDRDRFDEGLLHDTHLRERVAGLLRTATKEDRDFACDRIDEMLLIGIPEATEFIDKALADNRLKSMPAILAGAIRLGHPELTGELIRRVHVNIDKTRAQQREWDSKKGRQRHSQHSDQFFNRINFEPAICFLRARTPVATNAFIDELDATGVRSSTTPVYPNPLYLAMLYDLHAAEPKLYFQRIISLMKAQDWVARLAAEESLDSTIYWDIGFDALALENERSHQIAHAETILQLLADLSTDESRIQILRWHGVVLNGTPSESWIPTLSSTAVSLDSACYCNALPLIERIRGRYGPATFADLWATDRKLAIAVYLKDTQP